MATSASGNQGQAFLRSGATDVGFYYISSAVYYKIGGSTGYIGNYTTSDIFTVVVASSGVSLLINGSVVQTGSYVSGNYSVVFLPYNTNEGFNNISFGYVQTGATGNSGSSGTSGTGFNTVTNASSGRILTSDGSANAANAETNLTFDGASLTVTGTASLAGHTIFQQASEIVNTSFGATAATVTYDFTTGTIWYHGTASTNYTANFVNMPTTNGRAITANIMISQGSTPYAPTSVSIGGTPQTVKWANGTYSVTANNVDIVGFTFLRSGNAWTQVLGQISTFS